MNAFTPPDQPPMTSFLWAGVLKPWMPGQRRFEASCIQQFDPQNFVRHNNVLCGRRSLDVTG